MTDNLATRTTIPYGVPNDRTVSNKAAINQTGQGTYMEYVTPWINYLSQDGLIVPNAGWWAFDVDLSMNRPEAPAEDNSIKLQMGSWNTSHTSLYSTMLGNIDGTMQGSFEAQTTGNIGFAGMASSGKGLLGKLKDLAGLKSPLQDVVTAWQSGNYLQGLKQSVSFGKSAVNVASGLFSKKSSDDGGGGGGNVSLHTEGTYEGVINMLMKGNANTDGIISGSQPTVGIASPTFNLKDFDTKNTHLGQGVWNLKKTPVVYRTNYLRSNYAKEIGMTDDALLTGYHQWYFMDPSSIEVELNSNVFPEDQIEWIQVDAICGVRSSMRYNGTDSYLNALGIGKNEIQQRYEVRTDGMLRFPDFLLFASGEMQEGLSFPLCFEITENDIFNKDTQDFFMCGIVGRGTKEYILEPSYGLAFNDYGVKKCVFQTPAYEVNVTVTVKLKNTELPFIFNRIYLPEIQNLNINDLDNKIKEIENKKNLPNKTDGHKELYDYQIKRLKELNGEWNKGMNNNNDNDY